jgi:hypothetical protein
MYYNKRMDCPVVLFVLLLKLYIIKIKIYIIPFKRQDKQDNWTKKYIDMCLSNGLKLGGGYVFVMC